MSYAVRRPRLSDAGALYDLVAACDTEELGEVDYEPADAVDELTRVSNLDRDAWVAADGDRLVGYAALHDPTPGVDAEAELYIAPGGGDALEQDLRGRVESRAAAAGAIGVSIWCVAGGGGPSAGRLERAGYAVVRRFSRMLTGVSTVEAPEPPAGVRIRVPAEADLPAVHAVVETAFADHFGHRPRPATDWLRDELAGDNADPALWLLAEVEGRPVGVLVGRRMEGMGWVRYLGTLPECRGRGIGRALLRTSFATFARLGYPQVGLGVDTENATGALRIYESVGMRATFASDCWRRALRP